MRMISKCSDEEQTLRWADQRNASQQVGEGKRGREGQKIPRMETEGDKSGDAAP